MTDISVELDAALKKHGARMRQHHRRRSSTNDEFLKEGYRINSHITSLHTYLRSIRQPYLSTSQPSHRSRTTANQTSHYSSKTQQSIHLTNTDRDIIDAESKTSLRELNASIRQLESVEQIRKDTDSEIEKKLASRRGLGGALGRWAAGGSSVTKPLLTPEEELEKAKKEAVGMVRESVIWYLRRKLEDVVEFQRNMMETRVQREVERGKSVLYKVNAGNNKFAGGGSVISPTSPTKDIFADVNGGLRERDSRGKVALDEYDRKQAEQSLSPDQLQIFEKENNEMLKHYEDTLSQVRTAEQSILEISELQTTLAANLSIQAERIDSLVEEAEGTEENVKGGNKELKQATERWRPAKMVFWGTCGFCGFWVVWDLIF